MMTPLEFKIWCDRLNLNEQTRHQVKQIRLSEPSRRVGGGKNNVCGRYPSQKMGVTIQFESHRNELAHIYKLEYDEDVLEYYDQPPPIFLDYLSKNGRRNYHSHTPDIFAIRKNSAGWEEYKTEKELLKKIKESPNRWQRTESGKWFSPPGSVYAAQFGLYYIVSSEAEISSTFLRNFVWLSDYFIESEDLSVPPTVIEAIHALLVARPGITLAEVMNLVKNASVDYLNILIAKNQIYVDMESAFLGQPNVVKAYLDYESALTYKNLFLNASATPVYRNLSVAVKVGTYIDWDGRKWKIINPGEQSIGLLGDDGSFVELSHNIFFDLIKLEKIIGISTNEESSINIEIDKILKKASKEALKIANNRFKDIEKFLNGIACTLPTRTQRRWIKNYQTAEKLYGRGFIGLIPKHWNKGWRRKGIETEVFELMLSDIEENYKNIKQPSIRHAYENFKQKCIANGLKAPSKETYRQAVRKQSQYQLILKRMGSRAAYKEEPFYWYLYREETPIHGDRPWEICHIDHTEVDVELLSSIMLEHGSSELKENINMGRAWATLMIDAFSRRILAVYMSFDPPSYLSDMMVLRICVSRYVRLPQIIVVDGGRDFDSTDFEVLLAYFRITKKQRPPAKPRYGSVIESFFGVADKEFWHNLMGNTQIMKNVRQVTNSVNPKNHAIWTLPRLYAYFCEYCYTVYDICPHPALRMSPSEAFSIGHIKAGSREHTFINTEEFNLVALPSLTTLGGKRTVTIDGVKINYLYYWHPSFSLIRRNKVDVKYDPFDITVAYAYVQGEWVQCQSRYLWELSGHSVRELMIAAEELRKLNKLQNYQFGDVTAKKLVAFFKRIEMEEGFLTPAWLQAKKTVQQQRLKDAELKQVIALGEEKSHPKQPILDTIETKAQLIEEVVAASSVVNETFEPLEEW